MNPSIEVTIHITAWWEAIWGYNPSVDKKSNKTIRFNLHPYPMALTFQNTLNSPDKHLDTDFYSKKSKIFEAMLTFIHSITCAVNSWISFNHLQTKNKIKKYPSSCMTYDFQDILRLTVNSLLKTPIGFLLHTPKERVCLLSLSVSLGTHNWYHHDSKIQNPFYKSWEHIGPYWKILHRVQQMA